ncbi:DUF927 domain-containing protein [Crenalkalicoccus roseus]|uniref:DUF927 domain-containing protein n=1 Tax=Crenalkalicoccus roseus TaxID=1485588 RepID=UPI001081F048|nr:DUF927 domain-containing protein [Crenalkalicoccus roseus]
MPARLLMAEPGALEAELADRGLRLSADPTDRLLLRKVLTEMRAGRRVRRAYRTGWQDVGGGAVFLLSDGEAIGAAAEPVVLDTPAEDAARLAAAAGTLGGWQAEVATLVVGNPLAAFCVAAAFAAPLLHPLRETGGGFHLAGDSKRGKTTAMQMEVSVWGPPYAAGVLRNWNGTTNAFEAVAEQSAARRQPLCSAGAAGARPC